MNKIAEDTLGGRIKARRIELGITQEELAEALHTTKVTVSNYENNKVDMKVSVLMEVVRILGEKILGYMCFQEISEDDKELLDIYHNLDNSKLKVIAKKQTCILSR